MPFACARERLAPLKDGAAHKIPGPRGLHVRLTVRLFCVGCEKDVWGYIASGLFCPISAYTWEIIVESRESTWGRGLRHISDFDLCLVRFGVRMRPSYFLGTRGSLGEGPGVGHNSEPEELVYSFESGAERRPA